MNINIGPEDIFQFIVDHKYWLAAIVPFVLAVMALRARG
ncbi:MAG: hypothetical protein RLZZ303_2335 [Candidatus Hydrogenedentota bacterium]